MSKDFPSLDTLPEPLAHNPFLAFGLWWKDAQSLDVQEPTAMTLATVSKDGAPAMRIVLLKDYSDDGFVFFTNYKSQKGEHLLANDRASLLFWWEPFKRQVRIAGRVERTAADVSDNYFASRPRGSQLGAWASEQSQPLPGRSTLQERVSHYEKEYPDKVPRPPHWGGYRLMPDQFEFWLGQPDRLHDRLEYKLAGTSWTTRRLAP